MEQQHAIGKFSLEVQLPSGQDVFSLQSRLSNRCTTALAPLLAELLDSWTDAADLLQIDKLEIDLGSCSLASLEKELPEMIIAYLRKHYPGIRQQTYFEEGMTKITLGQGYFESWLYFLEHGILPHAAVKWTREEWEAGVLATLSAETTAYQQCAALLVSNVSAVIRLILQFTPAFVENWLLFYSGSIYQPMLQLVTTWEEFRYHRLENTTQLAERMQVLPARADFHLLITSWFIKEIVLPRRQIEAPVLLKELIELQSLPVQYWLYIFQQQSAAFKRTWPLLWETALKLSEPYAESLTAIEEELAVKAAQNAIKTALSPSSSSSADAAVKAADVSAADVPATTAEAASVKRFPAQGSEVSADSTAANVSTVPDLAEAGSGEPLVDAERTAEGTILYVNNAGLILLHPYLNILFDTLDLREEAGFKDVNKAIQLLGYLASGEDEIPEYDLVLPKLLCGILPSVPVKRFVPLTAEEKKEADELLQAVIEHWNALGSTTADGLRGNFLMREGKLEWKEEEWQLYVTQQPYDMLLNRLPWGFSVVGFSWMPWLIKTVWI
jgi:hypothetical protein